MHLIEMSMALIPQDQYVFDIIRDAGLMDGSAARPTMHSIIVSPMSHFQTQSLCDLVCPYLM